MVVEENEKNNGGTMNSEHVIQTRNVKRDTNLSGQTEGKIKIRVFYIRIILILYFVIVNYKIREYFISYKPIFI